MSDINSSRGIEVRTLRDLPRVLDSETRTIEIMVAPYGEISPVGGGERYAPGAFGDPGSVSLKMETAPGHGGPVVGRSVEFRDTREGLIGVFRISETRDGDDALTLAADGALGASAGFLPNRDGVTREDGVNVVRSAALHEVTLTATPAYAGAGVIEVRSDDGGRNMDQATETPAVETAPDSTPEPGYITADEANDLVTRAIDTYRASVVTDQAPAPIEDARHRGHEYRSIGELVGDTIAHARRSDPAASERLTRSIDIGLVHPAGGSIELRAFTGPANSTVDAIGVTPDAYIPDLLELLREGRPVADLFGSRQLPAEGNNVTLPRVTQGGTVGYQATQGGTVSSQNVVTDLPSFPKSTMAGGQGVSLQAQQWSNPSYMDEVIRDHVAAYAEFLDSESINGDGATPNATAYTGILNGATDVPVGSGDGFLESLGFIGTAWAAVYAGSRRSPIAAMMSGTAWGEYLNLVDTDGRPVVTVDAPSNPAGIGDAAQIAGTLRGLPVVLDEAVPVDAVILGSFRDALLFENQAAPAQIALTYPDVLVTDVSVYGFSALAIRRPAAFAVISGIGTTP